MLKTCQNLPPEKNRNILHGPLLNATLSMRVGLHPVAFSGTMTDQQPPRKGYTLFTK